MEMNLEKGLTGQVVVSVTEENTAVSYGSGEIDVFATPAMIGLMEKAALKAVDPHLPEGWGTVGIRVDVRHMAATPRGVRVYAEAKLIEIKGKRLVFEVVAFDGHECIGEGIHERFVIDKNVFMQKTEEKRASQ